MKHRRILSALLCAVMLLALCVTGAAAETATIKEVALTMTPLQAGQPLPTDIKVDSPSGLSVTGFQWYSGESGKLGSGAKVELGKTYVISFTVSVNSGVDAEFANSSALRVTVNGGKALYRRWDSKSFQYSANFFFEKPKEAPPGVTAPAEENYDTFDYRAYANIYPDLKAVYGYDAEKLYAHYVNYGKAEGRIGSFISGSNPKTNAPITAPKADGRFATLLTPAPPTVLTEQPDWAENECVSVREMSNVRLVAEYWFTKAYMDEARALREARVQQGAPFDERENRLHLTVLGGVDAIAEELQDRYEAVEEDDPNYPSPLGDVYGRAKQSDTTILFQFYSGYKDFSVPPADPGTPGNPPAKTVGGFSDVTERDYFADPVVWAVEKEITSGTGSGRFSPGQTCTQAQILTFLWRAKGASEAAGTATLPGVDRSAYYYKAALWAKEQGMIGDEFAADAPCTRAMAVTYLWKQAGSPAAPKASFTDVPADYTQAVDWAVEQGVTSGTGNNQFSPGQTCTRGQIVTFLYRAFAK